MPIRIIARFVAHPDSIETLRPILQSVVEPTRNEVGCISYALLNNKANSAEFVFIEEWESQKAIDDHMLAPHLKSLMVSAKPLLAARPDVQFYTDL